jgi:hypothetical protein
LKNAFLHNAKNSKWTYPILLIIAVIATYLPILGNDFLYFRDDQWVVMNRYTESGLNLQNLWAVLTEFYHGQYAPLNELLYLILYSIFGYNPFWFHLASLLLHAANVALVYVCIIRLLELNRKFIVGNQQLTAFITASIFALHPFNVESVAWMSASKILIYSFYYLLATLAFLCFLKNRSIRHNELDPQSPTKNSFIGKYYFFTLLLFICSFLGKEQAVSFPLWMLLIYWLTGYNFKNKKLWFVVAPFFILSLIFGIMTILSQTGGNSLFDQSGYPMWQRTVYACYSFTEYLLKSVFPFKLSYLYPFPSVVGEPLPDWLLIYPLLLSVLAITFWKFAVKNKIILFCLLFFGIHIAVALHIVSLSRFAVVADRYAYIAAIGVCFVIAHYTILFINKLNGYRKTVLCFAFAAYLLYFGIYSNIRCRVWHDTDSLKKEIRELLKDRHDFNGTKN